MFNEERGAVRRSIDRYEPRRVDFFEAWVPIEEDRNSSCRSGTLEPEQIQQWLGQEGEFAPMVMSGGNGGLRLIACDRISLHPPRIGMTEETFDILEDKLYLHPATLRTLLSATGTFSKHTDREDDDSATTKRIQILLKAPQKYGIANYGLSISFDVHSRMTTALLFGESVTNFNYDKLKATAPLSAPEHISPFNRLVEYLKHSRLSWDHPLLLSSALLVDHLTRTRAFCEVRLSTKVYQMEKMIDITQVGLRSSFGEEGLSPDFRAQDLDFDPAPLFDRKPWNKDASLFLGRIHDEMPESMPKTKNGYAFSELMEYNANIATALEVVASSLQSRMELQLNILYSFTSQSDNRINERIALNSGRDSTSMKILALISAFFLPGTFVATLFSMSMFQWQPNGGGGDGGGMVVSDKFWIYWAAAVPLTALTVIGWGVWWKWELNQYDKTMAKHVNSIRPFFMISSGKADLLWQGVTAEETRTTNGDGGSITALNKTLTSKTWRTETKDMA